MVVVRDISQIPHRITDPVTCDEYSEVVFQREFEAKDKKNTADGLIANLNLVLSSIGKVQSLLAEAASYFDEGAYIDNEEDYFEKVTTMCSNLDSPGAELSTLNLNLATLSSELQWDYDFCCDRVETWRTAITYLDDVWVGDDKDE